MSQRKKNAVLLIDVQYDFCNPNGALFVPGSVEDNKRLSSFILNNLDEIDYMAATLDSHHEIDIAHPEFWYDKDGKVPAPFTVISAQDLRDGKWTPKYYPMQSALSYLDALSQQGEFVHVIWPAHCLIGSKGHAIDDIVFDAIKAFDRAKGARGCVFVTKGTHPLTEHFGAFHAQVPIQNVPTTNVNMALLKTLAEYENIYLAGQARNFCVVNTLKQMINKSPEFGKKIIILDDCMSSVPGFDELGKDIWEKAKTLGTRITISNKEVLN